MGGFIKRLAKPYNDIDERLPLIFVHSMEPIHTETDYTVHQQFREKAYDLLIHYYLLL